MLPGEKEVPRLRLLIAAAPNGASFLAGTGKLWRLVEDMGFTYPVHSDFNTSRHYPAGLFPNILPAF